MDRTARANIQFALGIVNEEVLARAVTDITQEGWSHEQISQMAVWEIDAADVRYQWSSSGSDLVLI